MDDETKQRDRFKPPQAQLDDGGPAPGLPGDHPRMSPRWRAAALILACLAALQSVRVAPFMWAFVELARNGSMNLAGLLAIVVGLVALPVGAAFLVRGGVGGSRSLAVAAVAWALTFEWVPAFSAWADLLVPSFLLAVAGAAMAIGRKRRARARRSA